MGMRGGGDERGRGWGEERRARKVVGGEGGERERGGRESRWEWRGWAGRGVGGRKKGQEVEVGVSEIFPLSSSPNPPERKGWEKGRCGLSAWKR
jgi:hypothetical protein